MDFMRKNPKVMLKLIPGGGASEEDAAREKELRDEMANDELFKRKRNELEQAAALIGLSPAGVVTGALGSSPN